MTGEELEEIIEKARIYERKKLWLGNDRLTSLLEITWVNHGIHPDEFSVQT